jgi:hypothetical protein
LRAQAEIGIRNIRDDHTYRFRIDLDGAHCRLGQPHFLLHAAAGDENDRRA